MGFGRAARKATQCFHIAMALFLSGLFLFPPVCRAETALPVYEVKSAFLYNFAKFIQWPGQAFVTPDAPLVIGIVGHNPFGDYLDRLQGRMIGNHQIQIEKFENAASARKGRCQMLFIADNRRVAKIVDELDSAHADVLTITDEADTDSFQSTGAVINLVTTANRTVHFEINVDAARRAELKINSSLLNLAKIVRDGRRA